MAEDHSWMYSGWDKGETTRMSGWTRPQLFWTVLSHGQRLCGAHVAYARIEVLGGQDNHYHTLVEE
jgi:hypothetical protein